MNDKDELFKSDVNYRFEFNRDVASVFDDMIVRSIPYYRDTIKLIVKLLNGYKFKSLCDIGCSTGNLLLELSQNLNNISLVGIDSSNDMLDVARSKAKAYGANIDFFLADAMDFALDFDVLVASYTLQFIRPINRELLVSKIYNSLPDGGILILSEKLLCKNKWLDKQLIDIYHDFKRTQGYSNTEINKKREALENILIPYTQDENIELLKKAGFNTIEVLFRFANFATFIAIKD